MGSRGVRFLRLGAFSIGAFALMGIAAAAWPHVAGKDWTLKDWWMKQSKKPESLSTDRDGSVELVSQHPDTLQLPVDVAEKLGVQSQPVRQATQPRILEL